MLLALPAQAHEFWIAPQALQVEPGAVLQPKVRIGEQLDGSAFRFDPRAYAQALWVGPDFATVLNTRRLAEGDVTLKARRPGLHILAVASFPQTHIHATREKFDAYVNAERLRLAAPVVPQNGQIRETYSRFSKTLVRFGKGSGQDRRIGLAREWVRSGDIFTLYQGATPLPGQPARLMCRMPDGAVQQSLLVTDAKGQTPAPKGTARECLLNAVILEPRGKDWHSDWVSTFF
jgi:hypothetical protein